MIVAMLDSTGAVNFDTDLFCKSKETDRVMNVSAHT